jgi:hypothetical protein
MRSLSFSKPSASANNRQSSGTPDLSSHKPGPSLAAVDLRL